MYHSLPVSGVLQDVQSSQKGLSENEAAERLKKDGYNELPAKKQSLILLFLRQFNDILVFILIGALVLSAAAPFFEGHEITLGSFFDAFIILAILVLNAALGFIQEFKAEEAIAGLQKLSSPHCRVRRGGQERIVPSREVVRGDIIVIEAGDRISADGRLIEESHLEVNESSLTGESLPRSKTVEPVAGDAALADQEDMVFTGTLVSRGSGVYVVTSTGIHTQIGAIATLVTEAKTQKTPLEERMARLSKLIGAFVLLLCAMLVALGLWRGMQLIEVLIFAVSLAVSAVPEGLPAVVTVCLALGVRRMTKVNVIVRKLQSLETLGSVTVICSDKTGTITENRMKVRETWVAEKGEERLLAQIAASCNRAKLPDLGDPTEIGLLEHAQELDVERLPIDTEEVPFTSEEKYMQTRHDDAVFLKGAPEKILTFCNDADRNMVMETNRDMATRGLRVLGCAVKEGASARFVGLVGMEDPPREGIAKAVATAKRAGIRTMMITGDNVDTAMAIAKRVGIEGKGMEGKDIDSQTPDQLRKTVVEYSVYARVSPEHKLRILEALQSNGEIVAMSGDGVNDAPALKGAHVGVAMGRNGTEVAREASSIVLADDNYATIVSAVREGRHLYDNIRKFILFLMRTNFYQMVLLAVIMVVGLPLPYLPIHILWINLMTDGLPALALAVEGEEPNIMARPPRAKHEHIFSGQWVNLFLGALVPFVISLVLFDWQLRQGVSIEAARTMMFTFAILFEVLFTFSIRTSRPVWRAGFFSNRWLLAANAIPLSLQFVLLYTPVSGLFGLVPLSLRDWGLLLLLVFVSFLFFECLKVLNSLHMSRKKVLKMIGM